MSSLPVHKVFKPFPYNQINPLPTSAQSNPNPPPNQTTINPPKPLTNLNLNQQPTYNQITPLHSPNLPTQQSLISVPNQFNIFLQIVNIHLLNLTQSSVFQLVRYLLSLPPSIRLTGCLLAQSKIDWKLKVLHKLLTILWRIGLSQDIILYNNCLFGKIILVR